MKKFNKNCLNKEKILILPQKVRKDREVVINKESYQRSDHTLYLKTDSNSLWRDDEFHIETEYVYRKVSSQERKRTFEKVFNVLYFYKIDLGRRAEKRVPDSRLLGLFRLQEFPFFLDKEMIYMMDYKALEIEKVPFI